MIVSFSRILSYKKPTSLDYFFVLSGFVISYNYLHKIKDFASFKDFMVRRLIRLYPLLLYTTLLFFGLMLIGKHWNTFNDPYPVLFLQLTDTLTLMNSNPIFGSSLGINYPSWSISSEMISYALFGCCLFMFRKNAVIVLSLFLLGAGLFILYTGKYMYMGDFGFVRGLFCFILGYLVHLLSQKVNPRFGTLPELLFLFLLLLVFKYLPSDGAILLPFVFALGIFIFVSGKGIITSFLETKPAQFLGKISYSDGDGFDDVTATPDGGVIAAWQRGRDDIVQFDSQGNIKQIIRAAISTPADRTELNTRLAVDGRGNIYGLGSFTSSVFKFSRDGKYMNRFGGPGRQPGQLSAVNAIAVDGKGRVFVSDIQGIQVFDSDGRFVKSFRLDGVASGMAFTDQNELLVVSRSKVMKYTVNQ